MKIKPHKILLILIIIIAFGVRVWGIDFGLPQKQIIDEEAIVYGSFYTAFNKFRPLRYMYSPFVPYLLVIEFSAIYAFGNFANLYDSPFSFFASYLKDPTTLFLIARGVMAIFGVLTVYLTYKVGERYFGLRVGIIASFLLALCFLHVKESHYIKEDVISGMFVIVVYYFSLRILEKQKYRDYILAGIFMALAFAAKYQTVLMLPLPLILHLLINKKKFSHKLFSYFSSFFLSFILINPYFLVDFRNTITGIIAESALARIPYDDILQGKTVAYWYVFTHFPNGLGIFFYILSVFGILLCIAKASKSYKYLTVVYLPILFILTVGIWSQYHFPRYAIMTLPFFALSASILIDFITQKISRNKFSLLFLLFITFVSSYASLKRTINFNRLITSHDTRFIALDWINKEIRYNSKVVIESTQKPEYPSNLNVAAKLSKEGIAKRIIDAKSRNQPAYYLEALNSVTNQGVGYQILSTPRIDMSFDIFTNEQKYLESYKYWYEQGADYIVLSSWAIRPNMDKGFADTIDKYFSKVKEFYANPQFPNDLHFISVDYQVLDSIKLFDKSLTYGPHIVVYKRI